MRAIRSASAFGSAVLLAGFFASPSAAQDYSKRAPFIRVYSQNGPLVSNYVTPAIEVGEDAYVFAVAEDMDGQIQILHPDFPGISVKILRHKELRLPNFFAGFTQQQGGTYDASGRFTSYDAMYGGGDEYDSRGSVIALSSRVPFNLERIEADGDWNISAIRRLIEHRSPGLAAQALAAYLGVPGEPIGRDYMRFVSPRSNYYASNALYACDLYYGGYNPGLAFSRLSVLNRVQQLRLGGQQVSILGYDFCGMPIIAYGRRAATGLPAPAPQPHQPRDSSRSGRFTQSIPRSGPGSQPTPRSLLGFAPITRRAEPPRTGDVTVIAPRQRTRDPREILLDLRNNGGNGGGFPERTRVPIDRTAPSGGSQSAPIGTQPVREFSRPVTHDAPPPRSEPSRGPDRSPPPAPAPQVERSSSPPPPPPPRADPRAPSSPPPKN